MSEKINSILSDPQTMSMIQSFAASLSSGNSGTEDNGRAGLPQPSNGDMGAIADMARLLAPNSAPQQTQPQQGSGIDISQLASIMGALNLGGQPQQGRESEQSGGQPAGGEQGDGQSNQSDAIMQVLIKVMPLLNQMKYDDDRIKLLHALKPLVGEDRRERVDYAEKLIRLMSLLPQIGGL